MPRKIRRTRMSKVTLRQPRLLLACILYAASIHLPALHDLVYAEDECAACEQVLVGGSRISADCDASRPCENPEHHHHHRHQHAHGQCLSCQHASTPALPVPLPAFGHFDAAICVERARSALRFEPHASPGLYLARAPPSLS